MERGWLGSVPVLRVPDAPCHHSSSVELGLAEPGGHCQLSVLSLKSPQWCPEARCCPTAESRGAPPPPQDPSPLRGTLGSSLRSPAEGEGSFSVLSAPGPYFCCASFSSRASCSSCLLMNFHSSFGSFFSVRLHPHSLPHLPILLPWPSSPPFCYLYTCYWASQVALVVKNLPANAGDPGDFVAQSVKNQPAMQETLVRFLGQEELLEKG